MIILTMMPYFGVAEPDSAVRVDGEALHLDEYSEDFAAIPEGGEGHVSGPSPIRGPVRRMDGVLHATVRVRLGPDAAPMQPEGWTVEAEGDVPIPAERIPTPAAEEAPE